MSKSSERVKKWRKATKQRIIDAMGGKCQCCGYDKCNESMDLHHLVPDEKEFSFGSIRANPTAWPNIVAELRKCILVCRNCHGELHYGDRKLPEVYDSFNESYVNYRPVAIELTNPCPVCQKSKPFTHQFCSVKCSGHRHRRVDWDNIPLLELLKTQTMVEIAEKLDISHGAVWKRRRKLMAAVKGLEPFSLD